jgi:polygalacturonase
VTGGSEQAAHPTSDLQSPGSNVIVPCDYTDTPYDACSAFNAAISAANQAGGGRVVVPAGNWYCGGPIVLLSNVNFHLTAGCTIYFSPNPADYAKNGPYRTANGNLYWTRWQANDCLNFGSPIYAYQQKNIAVTADDNTCVLNGQARRRSSRAARRRPRAGGLSRDRTTPTAAPVRRRRRRPSRTRTTPR